MTTNKMSFRPVRQDQSDNPVRLLGTTTQTRGLYKAPVSLSGGPGLGLAHGKKSECSGKTLIERLDRPALERLAVQAHDRGERWSDFWDRHGDHVRQVEPWDRERFHGLTRRLLMLLCCGDLDGEQPPGDVAPWESDDSPKPDDTTTAARINWEALGIEPIGVEPLT